MVKFIIALILLCTVLYVNAADQIVVAAFQKIFKYAAAAKVKTLTTNCNKATTAAKAKKVVTTWVPKNWKADTATLNASDPYSKQAYAQKKGLAFIDYRYALKAYIKYMYNQAVNTKYLTAAEGKNMTTMFWAADLATSNNFTLTCVQFVTEASKALNSTVLTALNNLGAKFAKANPKAYASLGFTL